MTNTARQLDTQSQPTLSVVPQLTIDFGGLIDLHAFSSTKFVLDNDGSLKAVIEPTVQVESDEEYNQLPNFQGPLLNAFNDSYIRAMYFMDFRGTEFREEKNVPAALNSFEAKLLGWKLKAMQSDALFQDASCLQVGDVISIFDREKQQTDRVAMVAGFNDEGDAIICYSVGEDHIVTRLCGLYRAGERLTVHQYQYAK
ncbi:MAG: hypothetical protein IPG59_14955 [Candidatus Melainabacteria bacterium]|nr:MAG: hypothetical protein IPG59_14955 [Candidatus Melainabacteria bacterium]